MTKVESIEQTPGHGTSGRIAALTMLDDQTTTATRPQPRATRKSEDREGQRQLGKDNDRNGYFVDADGNAYEPYAMAWRYLGLFIDCSGDEHGNKQRERRRLNNDNDGSSSCQRRLLWAAYHDAHYRGGSMGEYSLLDRKRDVWEMATCRGQTFWPLTRCKKMDCHARHTSWQLIGAYKESDGLDDWTEQLFKHHGYCHWGQDVLDKNGNNNNKGNSRDGNDEEDLVVSDYEFMQNVRETWSDGSSSCRQLNLADADGNLLYAAVQPLKRGDMTMGLYSDSACLEPASSSGKNVVRYGDYLAQTAGAYDDNNDAAYTAVVSEWQSSVDRWNDLLSDYKVCQPCRAFSQTKSSKSGNKNNSNNNNYGSNEGEGSTEQWGFNCYDDAGYRNCNQCYKFATKTDMKEASVADLQEATRQGTILAIQYTDGVTYGAGHPVATQHARHVVRNVFVGMAAVAVVTMTVWVRYRLAAIVRRRRQVKNVALQEDMLTVKKSDCEAAAGDDDSTSADDSSSSDDHRRRSRRRQRRSSKKHPRGVDEASSDEQKLLAEQIRARDTRLAEMQQELDQYRLQHQQRMQQWQQPREAAEPAAEVEAKNHDDDEDQHRLPSTIERKDLF